MPRTPNQDSGQGSQQSVLTRVQASHFSGPLPPTELLARYDDVIPGGAERILAMAEHQSAHRESLEAQVVAGNISSQKAGSAYAFVLSLVAIAGGVWLIHEGKSVFGLTTILSDLAVLAGVFVYSRRQQSRERVQKSTTLVEHRRS